MLCELNLSRHFGTLVNEIDGEAEPQNLTVVKVQALRESTLLQGRELIRLSNGLIVPLLV